MELVQGVAITKYCDQHQLPIRERLELFIPVCQAVQHAHQKGIIHRDIKPSNILVAEFDGRPVPKVIDFGVAKAIDHGTVQQQLSTQYGQIVGTLEYMSPEQARLSPHDVDTRSDVYSLGAVLYELLTGITPFDKDRLYAAAFEQALHIIEAEEPPPPSQRLSSSGSLPSVAALRHIEPQRLTGLIRGELDWIVMKSLEKDRSRRYESAAGLAQDIDRYLHDQPVLAGPPSTGYLLRKFVRRNKSILATTTMVAVALVVGTGVAAWQAVRAHDQALRAEAEKTRAQATLQTAIRALDEMYGEVAQQHLAMVPRMEQSRVSSLENAVRYYAQLTTIDSSNPVLRYERANAYRQLGRFQHWLGNRVAAEPNLRTAIMLFERLLADCPQSAAYQHNLSLCCIDLATLLDRDALHNTESAFLFQRAMELLEDLRDELKDDLEFHRDVAFAQDAFAWHFFLKTDYERAALEVCRAVNSFETLLARQPNDDRFHIGLSLTYRSAAHVNEAQGLSEGVEAYYEKAINHHQQAVRLAPGDPEYRYHMSVTYWRFGRFLERSGRPDEACGEYQKSLDIATPLLERFPLVQNCVAQWSVSMSAWANVRRSGHTYGDIERTCRETARTLEEKVAGDSSYAGWLASAQNVLAWLLATCPDGNVRNPREAVALATQAVDAAPTVGQFWNTLGIAQYRDNQWDASIDTLVHSCELLSGGMAYDFFFLAMANWQLGNTVEARRQYECGVLWMQNNRLDVTPQLEQCQTEAATLLNLNGQPVSTAPPSTALTGSQHPGRSHCARPGLCASL